MKVLVGVQDDTEHGLEAIREAVRRCASDGTIVLVGYLPTPTGEDLAASLESSKQKVRARCQRQADWIESKGPKVQIELPVGTTRPSQAILRVAQAEAVDLIVIGLRRRSRVGKLVLGSNAQDILLGAHAPVLSVKAPRGADGGDKELT